MRLDLELLETFIAIADGGGFTRAGERLHKTQSTVSRQLGRLEEQVGTTLITRNTRGLALTEQGELLLGYARRLLDLHAQAVDALDGTKVEGLVRIGTAQDVVDGGLAQLLSHFARLHPGVRLEVRVDANCRLREKVGAGDLDLAVVLQERGDGGEVIERLDRVWVAGAGFQRSDSDPLPLVLFDPPCIFRNAALNALERAEIPWRVVLTTPSFAGLRAAVRAGLGVSVRTSRWLEDDLQILREGAGMPALPDVELALHMARCPRTVAMERLLESVRDAVKALARE